MASRLINVRLDDERARKARTLQANGIVLSDLVREAIDERFEELRQSAKPPNPKSIIQRIFAQYPDPSDLPPRTYNVHDRREARQAIRKRLRRKR